MDKHHIQGYSELFLANATETRISAGLMGHVAHVQILLPPQSCCLPLLDQMLVQNISYENVLS